MPFGTIRFEISSAPVRAVIDTHPVMSVPAFVMKIFEPLTIQARRGAPLSCAWRLRPSRLRLGQAERCEPLARGELGQPLALLRLGAEEEDRHRPERGVRSDGDRDRRVDARQLLDRERVGERVGARAAVLLGDRDPHQPELGQLGDELVGEARLAVEFLRDGGDALACERANGVADQLVLG